VELLVLYSCHPLTTC